MKSKIVKNRYIVECSCFDVNHLLVFDFFPEKGFAEVYFTNNFRLPWHKRIWPALKYLFWKSDSCLYGDISITDVNIEELQAAINRLKKHYTGKP